jgi:hypothetical protein
VGPVILGHISPKVVNQTAGVIVLMGK